MAATTSGRNVRGRQGAPAPASIAILADQHVAPPASLASIASIGADGTPMVSISGASPVPALRVASVCVPDLVAAYEAGAQVAVMTLSGNQLLILGVLAPVVAHRGPPVVATLDGRCVNLIARDEIVLSCGKASITLCRSGKVIIKGTYVSTASAGVNRITGSSVQIN